MRTAKRIGFGIVYTLLATLVTAVCADTSAEARKAIQAAYDKQAAATMRKDVEAATANNVPDYKYRNPEGDTQTLAHLKETMKDVLGIGFVKSIDYHIVIQKFVLKGRQATVTIKDHIQFHYALPNGKKGVFVGDSVAKDTWAKQGKAWKRTFSDIISEKDTADGKPVNEE